MPPKTCNSWLACCEAIGRYRAAVAAALGKKRDTVDKWCIPQPAANPYECESTGRPNPLDILLSLTANAEHPDVLKQFVAEAWGCRLVPKIDTPHDGKLVMSVAVLREAIDELLRELNRRKPKKTAEQVKDIRDGVIDGIDALVADYLARRGAGT